MAAKSQKSHNEYTIGWVCALPKEQTAAIAMLDERHENLPHPAQSGDDNSYALGSIGVHNIVIACLPKGKIGTVSAASVALHMIRTFPNIKFGLMVGIGGGIPNKGKIRLGDVVVGTPTGPFPGVVQWDIGKATQGGGFERTGALNNPPNFLLTALGRLETEQELSGSKVSEYLEQMIIKFPKLTKYVKLESFEDVLFKSSYDHRDTPEDPGEADEEDEEGSDDEEDEEDEDEDEEEESCRHCDKSKIVKRKARDMRVHFGLIASGNQVIKDAKFRDDLNKALGGQVLCVEMEAAGLLHNFPCIVIRGICDYADSHKNKVWQEHSAAVAAAFAKELLGYVPASDVDGVGPVKDIIKSVARIEEKVEKVHSRLDRKDDLEVLDWFTPIDYTSQQTDYLNQRQQGTGEWLLNSTEYKNWLTADINKKVLFCPGIPGAGKTILTSIVVDDLTTRFSKLKIGLAYIYCNFRRKDEQKIQSLLASLLKQLALTSTQSDLPEAVKEIYQRNTEKRMRPSIDDIFRALQSVSKEYERVFIIVDALDECQTSNNCREIFLSKLFQLQSNCGTNLFITSRALPEIMKKFGSVDAEVLEVRAHKEDVRNFLEAQISSSGEQLLIDCREEIKDEITNVVDGMFLLAQLHFEAIKTKTSLKKMRSALKTLSAGEKAYDNAYEDAMARIEAQSDDFKDLAYHVLWWIIRAKRPINTAELRHALGVEVNESRIDEENCPENTKMASVCAGLVMVDEESQVIRLVHYTTQEYFERTWTRWFSEADRNIAETCVTYLSHEIFMKEGPTRNDEDLEARLQSNPLYDYAANHWGYHVRISLIGNTPLVMTFLESRNAVLACSQAMTAPIESYDIEKFEGWTGVHLAAYAGVYESVVGMLDKEAVIDVKGGDDQISLPSVKTSEQAKAKPPINMEIKDGDGRTPLSLAVASGQAAVVKFLINRGADLEAKDKSNRTPLLLAVVHEREEAIELLIDGGADLEVKDRSGRTPLLLAVLYGRQAVLELLIERGADLEAKNKDGRTPLGLAIEEGHEAMARFLIDKGANLEAQDNDGKTILILATLYNRKAMVELLINKGANLEATDKRDQTPLYLAAFEEHHEILSLLMDGGANLETEDGCGQTPLSLASEQGSEEVVRLLMDKGANLEALWDGQTALCLAAEGGYEAIVGLLIDRGADMEVQNDDGMTPLCLAAKANRDAVARLLIDKGASLETKDREERTALFVAAEDGNEEVVRLLISKGADLETKNEFGQTPLCRAAGVGWDMVAKPLLDAGANADARDEDGATPLCLTAETGCEEVAVLLIDKGVDLEARNQDGQTPLALAAKNGREAVVRLLIDRGANITSKDEDGRTPLRLAEKNGYQTVAMLLKDAAMGAQM
ncbi:hypothetical protein TWF703_009096 [Orbilia oligospora]|uniref:Uncharacterized protein n=1 Tax=Orbilia oligospora TaxID=2813651 RepID=A0A7C8JMQ1_ORBOL|nr:hypothetical protein TWF703_009096 [Orbilia oligospora]